MNTLFRALPSVDVLLAAVFSQDTVSPEKTKKQSCLSANHTTAKKKPVCNTTMPRGVVRNAINDVLNHCRHHIKAQRITDASELSVEALLPEILLKAQAAMQPHFRHVINATGVVIHTNMGRSLLADEATQAVTEACALYSNLEFDLATGERGSRYSHVEELLCRITGAEAALVVNNNAAAVLLVLDTLCKQGEVLVSRGQLVEIGGSFRIPDVLAKSGATLREVGATNRTHIADYESAITDQTVALLRVHTSNYRIIGFQKSVSLSDLVTLGQKRGLPVIEDLGSGSFIDFTPWGLPHEPTVQSIVADNPDVVTFSGDKVLGGPQAGLIVGRRQWIERIKRNPLTRALRIDKMTLAALEATLRLYLDPEKARQAIPTLRMITFTQDELRKRARRLRTILRKHMNAHALISTTDSVSKIGGGSFPEQTLPTCVVRVKPQTCTTSVLRERLLQTTPPLVGRIEADHLLLDPRTIQDEEYALVATALKEALTA